LLPLVLAMFVNLSHEVWPDAGISPILSARHVYSKLVDNQTSAVRFEPRQWVRLAQDR
jgi:hypothetical protein